jgi:hypothetical protein
MRRQRLAIGLNQRRVRRIRELQPGSDSLSEPGGKVRLCKTPLRVQS